MIKFSIKDLNLGQVPSTITEAKRMVGSQVIKLLKEEAGLCGYSSYTYTNNGWHFVLCADKVKK